MSNELEILGSHGMQAHKYGSMMTMIKSGKLPLNKLIGRTVSLEEGIDELVNMDTFSGVGVTVINEF